MIKDCFERLYVRWVLRKRFFKSQKNTFSLPPEMIRKATRFANSLFAGSLNTLRIITILDADDKPTVLAALMRMGANESVCVDNASQGGVFSDIDIQTGQMYAAICSYSAQWLRTSGNDINTYSTHPITGAPM